MDSGKLRKNVCVEIRWGSFWTFFGRRGGERGTSETVQLKTEHLRWEMLRHCLLGARVQRRCSLLCSLTRLHMHSLLACRSMLCGRYVSDKMLKIAVSSSSSHERARLAGNLIFHQKKGWKRTKVIHSSQRLSMQCIDHSLVWLEALSDRSWAQGRARSVTYVSEGAAKQAAIFSRCARAKHVWFLIKMADNACKIALQTLIYSFFHLKCLLVVDATNRCVSFWQGQNDTLENGTGNYWFY